MVRRQPKLRELEVFRTLLRTRSMTAAGHLLGVSQPAVSKAIRQLEDSLGFALFQRLGTRILPTPEAEALLPSLEGVFGSVAALVTAGQAVRDNAGGPVTIAAIPTIASVVVPGATRRALAEQPELRVSVLILPTRQVVDAVMRGAADIGLVHDTVDEPALHAEALGVAAMACLVPPAHPFARRSTVTLRQLARGAYASFPVASPIGDHLAAAFAAAGLVFAPRIEASSSTVLCEMSLACGMPTVVEDYALRTGWWPGIRVLRLLPAIALRPRLIGSLQRPWSRAAAIMTEALRATMRDALARPAP